jgi:hypothetical protein
MKKLAVILFPLVLFGGAAMAADNTCFKLSQIDESPVIDDNTILLKMKNGDFQRVDLRGRCPSLKMSGFAHRTPSDDFCTSTVLTVRSPGKATCMVERIVEIDRAEADALASKK